MDFKSMVIRCIQEDSKKVSDVKSACSVFERYMKMSDLDVIAVYEEYFGLDNAQNEDDFLCAQWYCYYNLYLIVRDCCIWGLNILLQQSSMFSLCFFLPPLVKALFHYLYSWRKSPYEAPIASYPKNDVDRITKLLYHGYLEQDEKVFTLFLLCQFIFFRLYRKCIEHFSIVNNRFFYKFNISCFRIIIFRCSFKSISPFYH